MKFFVKTIFLLCLGATILANASLNKQNICVEATSSSDIIVDSGNDEPAITFFVHGLGGHASDWSNTYSSTKDVTFFEKDPDSIIEKIRMTDPNGMNLYRISRYRYTVRNKEDKVLGTCEKGVYPEYKWESSYKLPDENSINFTNHTLIVLDLPTWVPMETDNKDGVYDLFCDMVDKTLISYYNHSADKKKARINLIGHSLGGLVNMRYAMEHKKTVANLISLGTPYDGSFYDNNIFYRFGVDDFKKQRCISGICGHENCNPTVRKEKWNTYYSENHDINFYALSGETGFSLVKELIYSFDVAQNYGAFPQILAMMHPMHINTAAMLIPGDVCVDRDSQMALGYNGAINYNKEFTAFNSDIDKRSERDLAVPHNLEAYDADMHNVILEALIFKNRRVHYPKKVENISSEIFCKLDDTWLIKVTNNVKNNLSIEYNSKMCNSWDADDWDYLEDIKTTGTLHYGQSTIIGVSENLAAGAITLSYKYSNNIRKVIALEDLNPDTLDMNATGYEINCTVYSSPNGLMDICVLSDNLNLISLMVTNNTGKERTFFYTTHTPKQIDIPKNWTTIEEIDRTYSLKNGDSTIIQIRYDGGYDPYNFGIFYIENDTRHIYYGTLNTPCTRQVRTFDYNSVGYTKISNSNGITIGCIGKATEYVFMEVTNKTDSDRKFEFNASTVNKDYGLAWNNITDFSTVEIKKDESKILCIKAGDVYDLYYTAVSYVNNFKRYVTVSTFSKYCTTATCQSNIIDERFDVEVVGFSSSEYSIKLKNQTGKERVFFYNKKTCNSGDASSWSGLVDIAYISVKNGETSPIIKISKNGLSRTFAFSYIEGNVRYILTAEPLGSDDYILNKHRYTRDVYHYSAENGLTVRPIGKDGNTWLIELENSYGSSTKNIEYSAYMCKEDNAINWNGFSTIKNVTLKSNEKTKEPIKIQEDGSNGYIALSYKIDNYRYIFYANCLFASGLLNPKTTALCDVNGMSIVNKGLNGNTWTILLTNNTGKSRFFYYNNKTCFLGHASEWDGLDDIVRTRVLQPGESCYLYITKNGTAKTIAISYVEIFSRGATNKGNRFICYADNLTESGSMDVHKSTVPYNSYVYCEVEFSILSQHGNTWLIEATNNSSQSIRFDYNSKMCFWDDAYYWEDLYDIVSSPIVSPGATIILRISTNGAADTLCISWISGNTRRIFYPQFPDIDKFEMTKLNTSRSIKKYNCDYGFSVSLVGKNGTTCLIDITNNRDVTTTFTYNSKTCFSGDAEKWSGLSDEKTVTLKPGEKTLQPIQITKNAMAETIAISFMSGTYRYIFFAWGIDEDGTMGTVKQNSFDTTPSSSSSNCVTKGTLITLADGSKKAVEDLTGEEMLLVWNFETGTYDYAPILFIDSDSEELYKVIKLTFSDGTYVNVVTEHGFYDTTLNKYVYLDENADEYIGHSFIKSTGNTYTTVTLTEVEITTELTTTYSPVTYSHLCYYVNDMLSMPGGISGLFNYFEVDIETMMYDAAAKERDVEKYGLLSFKELCELAPVSREMYDAVNGQYLKVALGKGMITLEEIQYLADRYSSFVPEESTAEENNEQSLKERVLTLLESYGYTLEDVLNYYIRSYTGCLWIKIPHSSLSNFDWDVTYNEGCYNISVSFQLYGITVNCYIRVS